MLKSLSLRVFSTESHFTWQLWNISEKKSVKFQVKIQTVAEKQRKTLGGYFILTHPIGMGEVILLTTFC